MSQMNNVSAEYYLYILDNALSDLDVFVTLFIRVGILNKKQLCELMNNKKVVSIIFDTDNENMAETFPDKVGWYNAQNSEYILPLKMGKEILFIGRFETLGFLATFRSIRKGVKSFRIVDPMRDNKKYSMFLLMLKAFLGHLVFRLSKTKAGPLIEYFQHAYFSSLISKLDAFAMDGYLTESDRVTIISGSLGPGGAERQIINTIHGLKVKGLNKISFLHEQPMQPPNNFFLPELISCEVQYKQLSHTHHQYFDNTSPDKNLVELEDLLMRLGMAGELIYSYINEFRKTKPKVVHTWLDHINVTAGLAAAIVGVPKVVVSCRSLAPYHFSFNQPYMKAIYKLLSRYENVIFLNNSKAGADDYEKWIGLPRGKIRVIHNGFNFDCISSKKLEENGKDDLIADLGMCAKPKIVGTVMRLSEEKNPELWISMAVRICLAKDDVFFLIVGDGPLKNKLEKMVSDKNLSSRIIFLGHRNDVYSLLSVMDVFVLTSRVEGLPNVVIEAQSLGVPVVSTAVGGVEEVIDNGVTGFAISKASSKSLSEKVVYILNNDDFLFNVRKTAPGMIREKFSIDRMISETVDVYNIK